MHLPKHQSAERKKKLKNKKLSKAKHTYVFKICRTGEPHNKQWAMVAFGPDFYQLYLKLFTYLQDSVPAQSLEQ